MKQHQLKDKEAELDRIEATLAEKKSDLITLMHELGTFEAVYLRVIGSRYARLDEINAQFAEAYASLNPGDYKSLARAKHLRAKANQSAQSAHTARGPKLRPRFKPWKSIKKLYREIAKILHPDLTTDENENGRRQKIMAEVNLAYEEGNEERLRAILKEWESSFEILEDEGIESQINRINCRLAQVNIRIGEIEMEMEELKWSDIYQLRIKVLEAKTRGRDLLNEMAKEIDEEINEVKSRLDELLKEVTLYE